MRISFTYQPSNLTAEVDIRKKKTMTKTGHFVIGYKTPLATGFTEVKIYIVSTLKTLFLNPIGQ